MRAAAFRTKECRESRQARVEHRYRDGVRRILPFAVVGAAFGASFGVLAGSAGVGAAAAIVMSATTFGGSAQFGAVSVLDAGGGAAAAIAAAVLLNARYAPISISIAPAFEGSAWRRFLEAQLVVDESWAISLVAPGRYSRRLLVGAGATLYVAWVGGTAVGALGSSLLGDPDRLGLDAAFPALFLALLGPLVHDRRALLAAVLGAALALALVPVAAPGVPILVASAVCLIGLVRR